nr:ShlB/FhaC/HecB family hemolysin secretion/activation protein [Burkholderia pseudomallei]
MDGRSRSIRQFSGTRATGKLQGNVSLFGIDNPLGPERHFFFQRFGFFNQDSWNFSAISASVRTAGTRSISIPWGYWTGTLFGVYQHVLSTARGRESDVCLPVDNMKTVDFQAQSCADAQPERLCFGRAGFRF